MKMMTTISIFLLVFAILLCETLGVHPKDAAMCIDKEKQSLLEFKQAINDPNNQLSSWGTQQDCCKWEGVYCHNQTGNVLKLDLLNKNLTGELSTPSLLPLYYLEYLGLSNNSFTGNIPQFFASFKRLKELHLGSNHFEGVISESHMSNLSQLQILDLSFNSHLEIRFHPNWIPPFQLLATNLANCNIGPNFPTWLRTQMHITEIDMSAAGISGQIPSWFYTNFFGLKALNLSYNSIYGTLPDLYTRFSNLSLLDLSSNHFEGLIPRLPETIYLLNLSNNRFSGKITSFCDSPCKSLNHLDFANNQLTGELPDNCFGQLMSLYYFNVANNNFSGKLPFINASSIAVLQLRNNNFIGEIPQSWQYFRKLEFIDLGENRLTGAIPAGVGINYLSLIVLSLSSNNFSGIIPHEICKFSSIHILDLSGNNIFGRIPQCINNFSAITMSWSSGSRRSETLWPARPVPKYRLIRNGISRIQEAFLIWKRNKSVLKSNIVSVKVIDLSSNNLIGDIPVELSALVGLNGLNLSRNNLSGILTPKIGLLNQLDFLDLSVNQLSGEIPSSLSNLSFLGMLDLSYNNFTGRIPSSPHLQTFDNSSYVGNPGLCGEPLIQACPGDELPQYPKSNREENNLDEEDEEQFFTQDFYISVVVGFIVGFWGLCCTLFFNKSCRHLFFRVLD